MAFTQSDMDSEQFQYAIPSYEEYSPWPIEIYILSKMIETEKEITEESVDVFIERFMETEIIRSQSSEKKTEFESMAKSFAKDFISKTVNEMIQIIKQYAFTWDVYSLSVLFMEQIKELQIDTENYTFMKSYVELLYKTILSDPKDRPTIESIVDEIKTIFSSIKKEEYQSFVNHYTSHPDEMID
jgi:hypothetical protein